MKKIFWPVTTNTIYSTEVDYIDMVSRHSQVKQKNKIGGLVQTLRTKKGYFPKTAVFNWSIKVCLFGSGTCKDLFTPFH